MAGNLVKNANMLVSSAGTYQVYDSEGNWRTIDGTAGEAPDWWFYLGGPDYPNFPNLDPHGFIDAGGQWSTDSVDGDPAVSRSIKLDFSDLRVAQAGGITQVIPLNQTTNKAIKFSCYCKTTESDGQPSIKFDVIGMDGSSSGVSLVFLEGTNDWTEKVKIAVFEFPVKYIFFHLSVQACNVGVIEFALPYAEEMDVVVQEPEPNNYTQNFNFADTEDDTDTIRWDTTNCTRIDDASSTGIIALQIAAGGNVSQVGLIVPAEFAKRRLKVHCRSAGTESTIQMTVTAFNRYRYQVWRQTFTGTTDAVSNIFENAMLFPSSVEKVDILVEHVSGDDVILSAVTLIEDKLFAAALSKGIMPIQSKASLTFSNLSRGFETLALNLDHPIRYDKLEFTKDDDDILRRFYVTNGKLGNIQLHDTISDIALFKKVTLVQGGSSTQYTMSTWSDPVDLYLNGNKIPHKLGTPHLNHPDQGVETTGGAVPGGTTRYYVVTAYKTLNGITGETGQSNEVRAVTAADTNTNRVPLEIIPTPYADGYRVYMTEAVQANPPYSRYSHGLQVPNWSDNSLILDVSAQELRDAGYLLWDINQTPTTGKPPGANDPVAISSGIPVIINTAYLWQSDSDNQIIHVTDDFSGESLQASVSVSYLTETLAVKYLPHSGDYYIATAEGIFQSDSVKKMDLYLVIAAANVVSVEFCSNTIWYTTSDGVSHNIDGSETIGSAKTFTLTLVGSKLDDAGRQVQLLQDGTLLINGNVIGQLPGVNRHCIGIEQFYDRYMTFDQTAGCFLIFTLGLKIDQTYNMPSISLMSTWDLSGHTLNAHIYELGMISYFAVADTYYASLDEGLEARMVPRYPRLPRPRLIDEPPPLVYPELVANKNFTVGATWPDTFSGYGASGIAWVLDDESPVVGARSVKQTFPNAAWASINTQVYDVVGGQMYIFSISVKSPDSTTYGNMGVQFIGRTGTLETFYTETFHSFQNTPDWSTASSYVTAPDDAYSVKLRVLNYGSGDGNSHDYYISQFSFKEYQLPPVGLDFDYMPNGKFTQYTTDDDDVPVDPIGWTKKGNGASGMTVTITEPMMQTSGNAVKIDTPIYSYPSPDNTMFYEYDFFNVDEEQQLELSFWYRAESADNLGQRDMWLTIETIDGSGTYQGQQVQKLLNLDGEAKQYSIIFPTTPAGAVKAYLRISFWDSVEPMSNYFEDISIKPYFDDNLAKNPDFSLDLNSWTPYVNSTPYSRIEDSVRTVNGQTEIIPHCAVMELPLNDAHNFNQLNQYVAFTSATSDTIESTCIVRFDSYEVGTPGMRLEVEIAYQDGTFDWQYADYSGSGDWETLVHTISPAKPVNGVYLHPMIDCRSGRARGIAWLQKVTTRIVLPVPTYNGLTLDVPDEIVIYDPTNTLESIQKSITASVTNDGAAVEYQGLDVVFSANSSSNVTYLQTNNKGVSRAILTVPKMIGIVTVTATLNGITVSKDVKVRIKGNKTEIQRGEFVKHTDISGVLYLEMETEKERKPCPFVPDRPGSWEVFYPTNFNYEQMPDFQFHYSPETDYFANPVNMQILYPQLNYSQYFDYLGGTPSADDHKIILQDRKEWYAASNVAEMSCPFGDGRPHYNWMDQEMVEWFTDRIIRLANIKGWYDSIYLDDFWGESYTIDSDFAWAGSSSGLLTYRTVLERIQAQYDSLMYMRNRLHMEGRYLTCNYGVGSGFDFTQTPPVFKSGDALLLHQPFDGVLREVWLYGSEKQPWDAGLSLDGVHSEIHFLKYMNDLGKWVVVQARRTFLDYESRQFCFSAYLCGKGDRSYFHWDIWGAPWGSYGESWHPIRIPEEAIVTGLPLEDYQLNSGLFSRKFEKAVALVNMADVQMTYDLPVGNWYTLRNGPYSGTITLDSKHGMTLMLDKP